MLCAHGAVHRSFYAHLRTQTASLAGQSPYFFGGKCMANKRRSLKIYSQSGYNYRKTPTIILRGNWLADMGFQIGDYISVSETV